jgi:hypothetical protein
VAATHSGGSIGIDIPWNLLQNAIAFTRFESFQNLSRNRHRHAFNRPAREKGQQRRQNSREYKKFNELK